MATGISLSAADKALHTSSEKANFHRLARLLMCGGLTLLREVFDSIHPPASLPAVLSHPATVRQLKGARLTRAVWEQVYLPSGGYGKSADFDITLLFRLLRTICHLVPPPTGWDCLPPMSDCSLESDLVRIKYYRNNIYGHNQTMEISDDEFVDLWREVSEALLRIAGSFSSAKRDEWKECADKFRHDPLTPDAESYVAELQSWYQNDMDTKHEVLKLRNVMESWNKNDMDTKHEVLKLRNVMESWNKNDMDTKDEVIKLGNKMEQMKIMQEQMNIMMEQMINIHVNVESFKAGGLLSCSGNLANTGSQLQEAEPQSLPVEQVQAKGTVGHQGPKELQTNQQNPLTYEEIWRVILSVKPPAGLLIEYLRTELGVEVHGSREGSLVITVSCSSLQVLERLWKDYRSGNLSEVVQQTLVTADVLEELGLSEVKLKTTISKEEYKAYKEFFMQSSGKI